VHGDGLVGLGSGFVVESILAGQTAEEVLASAQHQVCAWPGFWVLDSGSRVLGSGPRY
jgi:hypothetical protein